MQRSMVDHLFAIFDQSAELIEKEEDVSYLEALCLTGENIFRETVSQKSLENKLSGLYAHFFQEGMSAEDVRRSFQLAVLKGMKSSTQTQHQMTPDSVVIFIGYLVNRLLSSRQQFSILDPAAGTGNLLTGIMNQSHTDDIRGYGVEIDDLLIKLACTNANLQQKDIEFFHQDSLRPMLVDPVDITVCDSPVGIYPDQKNAETFKLGKVDSQSYSHFLMIEQGLKYTKQAGYLVYLIPNDLFIQDKNKVFHKFLYDEAVILGLLQLPISLFQNEKHARSILILQKKGPHVVPPKQALLAEMPRFSNKEAMSKMMVKLNDWFQHHLEQHNEESHQ
ncbi:site-specific DNA-methyltransferase (adenine-specific) [Scopulibacillus daqui]|uniref:Site-specific DNA-methyltransferase (Adenine-specific) n=1 Tax=Scopulibacillus daqui TaxID=1469162 RepID=A0ABS2PXN7_9BACL|nr:class I SAM-dependent methyltransferase [Scopulibacillus daqui]MBM7644818.1 site-specific DNA-methyltransferase (adenine-specific) [Scopulibacillus daqui]